MRATTAISLFTMLAFAQAGDLGGDPGLTDCIRGHRFPAEVPRRPGDYGQYDGVKPKKPKKPKGRKQ